jgi:hypothetical protein
VNYPGSRVKQSRRRSQERSDHGYSSRVTPQDSGGRSTRPDSPVINPVVQRASRGDPDQRLAFRTTSGRVGDMLASISDAVEVVRLESSLRSRRNRGREAAPPEPASPPPQPATVEMSARQRRRSRHHHDSTSEAEPVQDYTSRDARGSPPAPRLRTESSEGAEEPQASQGAARRRRRRASSDAGVGDS